MNDQDIPAFRRAIRVYFQTVHATGNVHIEVIANYWKALESYPLDKVIPAIEKAAQTETQHVPPARMVELVTGKKREHAKEAFADLLGLIKRYGIGEARNHVDENSKAYKVLKTVGGFRAINENVERAKSEFFAAWESA